MDAADPLGRRGGPVLRIRDDGEALDWPAIAGASGWNVGLGQAASPTTKTAGAPLRGYVPGRRSSALMRGRLS
jgi:hypothetical protein